MKGERTFISLGLLSELGEVDRVFTSLRHLKGEDGQVTYVTDAVWTRVRGTHCQSVGKLIGIYIKSARERLRVSGGGRGGGRRGRRGLPGESLRIWEEIVVDRKREGRQVEKELKKVGQRVRLG